MDKRILLVPLLLSLLFIGGCDLPFGKICIELKTPITMKSENGTNYIEPGTFEIHFTDCKPTECFDNKDCADDFLYDMHLYNALNFMKYYCNE